MRIYVFIKTGFTLVELLVAVFIFSLIGGTIVSLLVTGISSQRSSLGTQEVVDQISYVTEYMARALREARKDLDGTCLLTRGLNYAIVSGRLRFLDKNDKCREIYLDTTDKRIKERISADHSAGSLGSPEPLTSDNLEVTALRFGPHGWSQDDNYQPRVTIFIEMQKKQQTPESTRIQLQTTISQRRFDVQN